jgi:hypothetical protein
MLPAIYAHEACMKKMRWIFLLFALIGIVLLAAGVYTARSTRRFLATAEKAAGVVIENVWQDSSSSDGGTYRPRVRFRTRTGQDIEFVSDTGSMPAAYRQGEGVTIVYDPDDPAHASINGFWALWLGTVILFGLGIAFAAAGIGPLVWLRHQRRMTEWLRANGQRVQTTFERVELDTSLTVNGSHPYRIVSQWLNPRTNQVHVFKSESIWYDPAQYIDGGMIGVWIDPDNPKRYAMETGFLPRIAD